MQTGQIFQRHGAWHLRYRVNGKQVCRRLATFCDKYRTEKSVRPLADDILEPLNAGRQVNGPLTLQQFVETVYFPYVTEKKRPSTVKGYTNLYNSQVKERVAGIRLSDFRTVHAQNLLDTIESETDLSHRSLTHIKSLLSGIFTVAKRKGLLDGVNPLEGVEIPEGKPNGTTHAYSLEEVEKIIGKLDGVARVAVIVGAWTGLSLGELRGLKWEDIDFKGAQLTVQRTVWHGIEGPTKTEARNNTVHLLPKVLAVLKEHRRENPGTVWVFEGPYARPLDLATLGSKQIKSKLEGTGVEWFGFHALRRGLGTRLFANGTPIETVSRILRHGSVSVTREHYVKILDESAARALQNLPTKSAKK